LPIRVSPHKCQIHGLFGYALMAAGVMRIIEVCFVLQDGPSDSSNIRILQYLPPYVSLDTRYLDAKLTPGSSVARPRRVSQNATKFFLLVTSLSSTMFMGATDEEMRRADGLGIDHVTYALFVRAQPGDIRFPLTPLNSGIFSQLHHLPTHLLPGSPLLQLGQE
jgi:hypothetical protein